MKVRPARLFKRPAPRPRTGLEGPTHDPGPRPGAMCFVSGCENPAARRAKLAVCDSAGKAIAGLDLGVVCCPGHCRPDVIEAILNNQWGDVERISIDRFHAHPSRARSLGRWEPL